MEKVRLTDEEIRKRAIHLLANLVHYQNGKSHYGDDIETVIFYMRSISGDTITINK